MNWRLWQDRAGRFSWLLTTVLVGLCLPLALTVADAVMGQLGPRPYSAFIHQVGLWAFRFLLLSLLVTPLARIARWPALMTVRRRIGVAACLYAVVHLGGYAADQSLDLVHIASEIARRVYLTIGFVALLGLVALGVTSTDGMIKRLGGLRWRRLHALAYPIAILAVIHYFMQEKADVTEPTLMAGWLTWLLGYRLLNRALPDGQARALPVLLGFSLLVALATAGAEALGFWAVRHLPPDLILEANLSFDLDVGIRPAWYVLAGGLILTVASVAGDVRQRARRLARA
ncbi:protein-methionine-sulfoxide reductase heme-binding subunit MsrQ [Nitrospirillum sp. BR 11828]|uniref:sulfite oxidase heme-binding subunit YedZ n=1 Tax=Nitrospirillum sp. BR 11828 TaxID=3104325 RepID=UPI002ACACA13|nr:protein-methionine-sulfoxide reductase heme-binding subunit MsrQ [Nitrospirillum sp. BR 11828]MDZ5650521.1 protein-methionine-sulfoxide reductase heme-binding subunit MsrQ [Nitrospirillum sp. BR 11828]